MATPHIMVLGIGNILLTDEGFGVHLVNRLLEKYEFPDHVSVIDGGVMGMSLIGLMCQADKLIVVDIIRNQGEPGTLYRVEHEDIPKRIRSKNSMHQMDFLESMTILETAFEKTPRTTLIGVEPLEYTRYNLEMTPEISGIMDRMETIVLDEIRRLGGSYQPKPAETAEKEAGHVSCGTFENY